MCMALRLGALQDALLDAGASTEKASKAAEEMAGYEREFAEVRSELRLHRWMLVTVNGGVLAILLRVFFH